MRTPLCFLLLMASLCSGHAQQGLQCYSDLHRNITCEWDGVQQETGQPVDPQSKCTLYAKLIQNTLKYPTSRQNAECELKKQDDTIWRCVLHIKDRYLRRSYNFTLEASCENRSAVRLAGFSPHDESVKLYPPGEPTIENITISWSFSHPAPGIDYNFELQYRSDGQTWEEGESIPVCCKGTSHLLQRDLKKGQLYWARVRVRLQEEHGVKIMWSDWSPVASWETPVDVDDVESMESWLIWWAVLGALAVLFFLVALMFMGSRMRKPLLVPDPAKYFDGLYSVHKGNFKTWLGSFMAVDVLSTEQQSENISPVEVLKAQVCSSFSNYRYFYGSEECFKYPPPPPSGPLEPCQEFSPYDRMLTDRGSDEDANLTKENCNAGVTGSNSSRSGLSSGSLGTLQLCSSYKDLTRLCAGVQSPDSGISVANMDYEEEEEEEEGGHEESLETGDRRQESCSEMDERVPLARPRDTQEALKPLCALPDIEWSLFKKNPLPPLSPLHCSVPFLESCPGPDHCSSPKGLTQPEDSFDGLYGELEPSSDDYMPLKT